MVTKFNFYFLQPVVNKDWLLNCLKFKTWVSEKHFWVGKSQICTPDKPDYTTLEVPPDPENEKESVQESRDKTMENPDDSEEIVINRPKSRFTPGKSKSEISDATTNNSEAKNNDKMEDNDEDGEIVIKRPVVKTPMNNVQRRLTIGKKINFT